MSIRAQLAASAVLAFMAWPAFAQPVEITFANSVSLPQVEPYQKAIDAFNAANPDIKVKMLNTPWGQYWQQRQVDTASNNLPDVWLYAPGYGAQWFYGHQILPIDKYIEADKSIDLADANQTMLEYMTLDGKLYGIGYDFNSEAIYYNPALFDQAGVAYPKDGWSVEDLEKAARTISEKLSTPSRKVWGISGFGGDWTMDGWYRGFGAQMIDKDGHFGADNDGGIATLQFFANLVRDKVMPVPDATNPRAQGQSLFIGGNAAMAIGVGHSAYIFDDAGVDYAIARLPVGPKGPVGNGVGGAYVISASTSHPDEAYRFLSYITSGPVLAKVVTTGVPARRSAWNELSPHLADFAQKVQGMPASYVTKGSFQVIEIQQRVLGELWNGSLDAKAAMSKISSEAERALAAQAQK